jgi:hypothetical protein
MDRSRLAASISIVAGREAFPKAIRATKAKMKTAIATRMTTVFTPAFAKRSDIFVMVDSSELSGVRFHSSVIPLCFIA